MNTYNFEIRFATPAFLGDADQNGTWRTPPFKALIRQWWRVVYTKDKDPGRVQDLRLAEAELFGSASGSDGHRSRLRIRMGAWSAGGLLRADWQAIPGFLHEEVGHGGRWVSADSYLGFGPVDVRGRSVLRSERAIKPAEPNELALQVLSPKWDPKMNEEPHRHIREALDLVNRYGTLGGRSRNGWGSVGLVPSDGQLWTSIGPPTREWHELLNYDWPCAIGRDNKGPLIWQTRPFSDWKEAMTALALVRYRTRRLFPLEGIPTPHNEPADRHWLAYPVTKDHRVTGWEKQRLPNSLRLKVRTQGASFIGLVFHMPVMPEAYRFKPKYEALVSVWSKVHRALDNGLPGIPDLGLRRAVS